MRKRERLVMMERFCRWFKRVHGFYILIAIVTIANVASYLEKSELRSANNALKKEKNILQEQYDALNDKYLMEADRYSRIDSFTNNAAKRFMQLIETNNKLANDIKKSTDSLQAIYHRIEKNY